MVICTIDCLLLFDLDNQEHADEDGLYFIYVARPRLYKLDVSHTCPQYTTAQGSKRIYMVYRVVCGGQMKTIHMLITSIICLFEVSPYIKGYPASITIPAYISSFPKVSCADRS